MTETAMRRERVLRQIPSGIWALGFVSLLMDVSSEMIHGLLPVYLVGVMGASALAVGAIEGVAESTALITRIFSGVLSDWLGKRKLLAALGYGLAAASKPIFPLANSLGWVVAARFIDRIGKGVRGAPRDALIADIAPEKLRGASFGLRQALDTVGAFLGPGLAVLLMLASRNDFRLVFWWAVLPAVLSTALIVFAVREPKVARAKGAARFPLRPSELRRLGTRFWIVAAIAAVFSLARFSEAFLILRARSDGLGEAYAPLVLVVMNLVYALSAYPAGALSDRLGRRGVFLAGIALLIAADLTLAAAGTLVWVAAGLVLWGLHMGFTQGLLSALVADTAPADLRGTGFGALNLVTGVAALAASLIAGALWDRVGPQATFGASAALALLSLIGVGLGARALKAP
ncbi:MAG TPA: MFS transporter [Phenylobacterium sp.]|uniref:MFS transporter n=1 Tax=Phenylobacterium sp. TaxID=1871053 RepID=UPI002BFABED4|nr:MFS transporter [Phenylobacterium sp.]HSV01868.1 MFS transporter [Phenylobacterium sp.]